MKSKERNADKPSDKIAQAEDQFVENLREMSPEEAPQDPRPTKPPRVVLNPRKLKLAVPPKVETPKAAPQLQEEEDDDQEPESPLRSRIDEAIQQVRSGKNPRKLADWLIRGAR